MMYLKERDGVPFYEPKNENLIYFKFLGDIQWSDTIYLAGADPNYRLLLLGNKSGFPLVKYTCYELLAYNIYTVESFFNTDENVQSYLRGMSWRYLNCSYNIQKVLGSK